MTLRLSSARMEWDRITDRKHTEEAKGWDVTEMQPGDADWGLASGAARH